jgi:hypothetical protein
VEEDEFVLRQSRRWFRVRAQFWFGGGAQDCDYSKLSVFREGEHELEIPRETSNSEFELPVRNAN